MHILNSFIDETLEMLLEVLEIVSVAAVHRWSQSLPYA